MIYSRPLTEEYHVKMLSLHPLGQLEYEGTLSLDLRLCLSWLEQGRSSYPPR